MVRKKARKKNKNVTIDTQRLPMWLYVTLWLAATACLWFNETTWIYVIATFITLAALFDR